MLPSNSLLAVKVSWSQLARERETMQRLLCMVVLLAVAASATALAAEKADDYITKEGKKFENME